LAGGGKLICGPNFALIKWWVYLRGAYLQVGGEGAYRRSNTAFKITLEPIYFRQTSETSKNVNV